MLRSGNQTNELFRWKPPAIDLDVVPAKGRGLRRAGRTKNAFSRNLELFAMNDYRNAHTAPLPLALGWHRRAAAREVCAAPELLADGWAMFGCPENHRGATLGAGLV
jgi:hypothetical protein